MEETITLYHPELKTTVQALSEEQAQVYERSGWTRDLPKEPSAKKSLEQGEVTNG